jgi:hypothetical protein
MRGLLPIAMLCTGCMTSELGDPGDELEARTSRDPIPTTYVGVASSVTGDGYFLSRLDGAAMRCFDGTTRPICHTQGIDWSLSRLSETARRQMEQVMAKAAGRPGVLAIARGHWIPIAPYERYHPDGVWVLVEAWVAEPGGPTSAGEFVRVVDNGIMCVTAPCPHLSERQLYGDHSEDIDELDFTASGLRPVQVVRVLADTFDPDGVIVAGERYYTDDRVTTGTGRTVTTAYRRLGVK